MESVLKYLDWTSVGLALLVGLLSLLLLELFRWNSFRSQSPPGPKSLPFVGNLPQFSKDQMGIIRSLPKYGEMCSIFLGRKPTIVLNNMQLAKEAFVQNGTVFSGRPLLPLQAWLTKGYGIILANYGHSWRQQRRFALHTLRDFGLGKKTVEERVAEEAHYLIKEMLKQEVSNIICSIIFGDRFEYNDKRFAKLLEILNESIRLGGTTMAQEELKEDTTFHVENMMKSVFDLFIAGTETTATTLRWGLVYMMNHPDVQERCHEEIIRVLGFDRSPCMEDRAQLPYTHATVYEIQRYASITPLGLIHQTTEPALLRGYHLPKGSTIMVNLKAIMTDKQHWKYPDTFNPENFLDEKGQFCRNDAFLPFSLGPRVCLGEYLAKMELFIFFTSLLQRLKFSWPAGTPHPNMDGIVGTVRSPFPFNMICHSRETTH
ncbi:cytochrome P450 2H1-like isoform X2 [Pygocentrus nattereri]|uniref:cytochrome P450 2H1-like isoform X2 n=1 Tax=Pygocentrus nattereri TaxID=42514 RepID=UPI0018917F5A|nr:cytochrome P450 2H1-like isoform X2 [Pygocentrus nattereri]